MSAARHRPWFRLILLAANCAFPPLLIASFLAAHALWPWIALITAAVHAVLLVAILHPRCQWLGPVTCQFATDKNAVWLTIDDGPDGDSARLAEELRTRGVRATFFVIGERVAAHPDAAPALIAAGHTLANHTHTHPRSAFWRIGPRRAATEFDRCAAVLRDHQVSTEIFRPPVGHKPPALHPALAARGAKLISWTIGGRDGWSPNTAPTVRRILAGLRPGAIILLHECRAHSHSTILAVVDALLARGVEFVVPANI